MISLSTLSLIIDKHKFQNRKSLINRVCCTILHSGQTYWRNKHILRTFGEMGWTTNVPSLIFLLCLWLVKSITVFVIVFFFFNVAIPSDCWMNSISILISIFGHFCISWTNSQFNFINLEQQMPGGIKN